VTVAQLHQQLGRNREAENWFRTVLKLSPFERDATLGLAKLLIQTNRIGSAEQLCGDYHNKIGTLDGCLSQPD